MAAPIEDYAFIGDNHTGALVDRSGSIDWMCLPRFDSGAVFTALLGKTGNGRWLLGPADPEAVTVERRYRPGTLILETTFHAPTGSVRMIDFMPPRHRHPHLVRIVEGVSGTVAMRMELLLRFDYGWIVPWVQRFDGGIRAVAGPDSVMVYSEVDLRGRDRHTEAHFEIDAGDRVPFVMVWHRSDEDPPAAQHAEQLLLRTDTAWQEWAQQCTTDGDYADDVRSSLVLLKGLIHEPTGGVVAAPTTSLPEQIGGQRNWDYRYCWLRDASMTMSALVESGYTTEAERWRDWLLRAVAGDPEQMQIMYAVDGVRRLGETELPWLAGYEDSTPVRIGNAAVGQFQLDVPGEVLDAIRFARSRGIPPQSHAWAIETVLVEHLAGIWDKPDRGIWEIRGAPRHFVHSKVMAWVAFDRAATAIRKYGLPGDAQRWRTLADQIHADVVANGFDREKNSFVQSYGSDAVDASLLLIPIVGFLPASDPRVAGTIRAVEEELENDGFVARYRVDEAASDGLSGTEGAFLICSFWLIQAIALQDRVERARGLLDKMLALRNDVGLLSEEYDPIAGRMLGNFPQAFSHIGLVSAAHAVRSAAQRASEGKSAE